MAQQHDKHAQINYIKTKMLGRNVVRVSMNRRLTNPGNECYWNKTWKTNCAVRQQVNQYYTIENLMKQKIVLNKTDIILISLVN